ncbi:GntR family transcriptional regulator [Sphingobacterium olei]|uniref:GntR family transcriptional regulator n=1 Tax=Sphingobacterium olei TaxID=2571155 RepID=A0A4U0PD10_9SPHI|nr:GntR family transcriptional regulator [Sphingobacterium olei]TJZ60534.1 GntR family transcriptional regulator [Sphingobacterium olei]
MKGAALINSIHINNFSSIPMYMQLADGVIEAVKNNIVKVRDPLPSINELSMQLRVSRDTVEKGYNFLKKQEVIKANPGKGYFILKREMDRKRIAIFLNKLSVHKKIVYDSFAQTLGSEASLDLFVYNSDISHLRSLLKNLSKSYDRYVVFPHFKEGRDQAAEVLSLIPPEKIVLLGKTVDGLEGKYAVIYEDYEKDIYEALERILEPLSKYKTLKLVFPDKSDYPKAIIKGFYKFCQEYAFDHILVDNLDKESIKREVCYINLAEDDLVLLLDKIIAKEYQIGKDVGVISYNETPLKKYMLNGITTISADFELMGKYAAQCILDNSREHMEVPFYTNLRSSL